MDAVKAKLAARDALEEELEVHREELTHVRTPVLCSRKFSLNTLPATTQMGLTLHSPLVDAEGFPRAGAVLALGMCACADVITCRCQRPPSP